jgi:hypothetical protein
MQESNREQPSRQLAGTDSATTARRSHRVVPRRRSLVARGLPTLKLGCVHEHTKNSIPLPASLLECSGGSRVPVLRAAAAPPLTRPAPSNARRLRGMGRIKTPCQPASVDTIPYRAWPLARPVRTPFTVLSYQSSKFWQVPENLPAAMVRMVCAMKTIALCGICLVRVPTSEWMISGGCRRALTARQRATMATPQCLAGRR